MEQNKMGTKAVFPLIMSMGFSADALNAGAVIIQYCRQRLCSADFTGCDYGGIACFSDSELFAGGCRGNGCRHEFLYFPKAGNAGYQGS